MNKIAMVIPYFGNFGNYFQLFLNSCEINDSIDFILYTDCDTSSFSFPSNVYVKKMSFKELQNKIKESFDFPVSINCAYKLCDFKPFYGLIFKEDLGLYEFWGHCDVDMILGKIKDFVTDEILQKYDRILSHGHFTIYRNLESVMSVNKQKLNGYLFYEDVLSKPENFSFDEWAGDKGGSSFIWQVLCRDKMYDEIVFHDIWVLKKHFVSYHFAKSKLNGEPLKDVVFVFDKKEGLIRISRNKREKTMYVHLQKRPMKISADFDFQSSKFIIVPNKFIKYTPAIENSKMLRFFYGHTRYFYLNAFVMRFNNLLRKLRIRLFKKRTG